MTREEAEKYADNMTYRDAIKNLMKAKSIPYRKATFIKVNELLKALEQEPCADAISREELLKAIDTWDKFGYTETGCFVREPKGDYVPYIHYDDVIKSIKGMPPVTPQYTEAEIQRMQELEQAEIQQAYEIGKEEGSEVLDKIRSEVTDTLYVDSLIFGELMDFKEGKISADDVIEEFNRVTKTEIMTIIDRYLQEVKE